ncbi:MAG: hypothetical protein U0792_09010 [Gemmataceae bacterium]
MSRTAALACRPRWLRPAFVTMFPNLLRHESALREHSELERPPGRCRFLANLPRRDLHVLGLDRVHYFRGRKFELVRMSGSSHARML